MTNRDRFERAYMLEVGTEHLAEFVRLHRHGNRYLFGEPEANLALNSAWWAWQAGQASLVEQAGEPPEVEQEAYSNAIH